MKEVFKFLSIVTIVTILILVVFSATGNAQDNMGYRQPVLYAMATSHCKNSVVLIDGSSQLKGIDTLTFSLNEGSSYTLLMKGDNFLFNFKGLSFSCEEHEEMTIDINPSKSGELTVIIQNRLINKKSVYGYILFYNGQQ